MRFMKFSFHILRSPYEKVHLKWCYLTFGYCVIYRIVNAGLILSNVALEQITTDRTELVPISVLVNKNTYNTVQKWYVNYNALVCLGPRLAQFRTDILYSLSL